MTGFACRERDRALSALLLRAAEGGYFDEVGREYAASNGSHVVAAKAVRLARRLLGRDVPFGAAEEVCRYQRIAVSTEGFNALIAIEQELADRLRARRERRRVRAAVEHLRATVTP